MDRDEIRFGRFRLDLRDRKLLRDDQPMQLGGRASDILCALASAGGGLVSKDELMARLWPGRVVEEGNIHVAVSALRKALDDHGEGHSYVVTVPGHGYRLAGIAGPQLSVSSKPLSTPDPSAPSRPSIAVLPFDNLSGDPGQDYFCDGMVVEIIAALSRIRWLFVIAPNSSFAYRGRAVDVTQVGRELGVRYVLDGSVRKSSGRVRIATRLVESETGAHLWADRFDGALEDVFNLQDQVAINVAGVIEPTLQAAEIRRSRERRTDDLTAYDLYLRALPHLAVAGDRNRQVQAFKLLDRAIKRDQEFGPALVMAAVYHYRTDIAGWTDDPETNRQQGIDLARRALRAAPDDPIVLATAAFTLGYFGSDIDAAIGLIDRALILNPSYAEGWYWSGVLRNWAGQPDTALQHFAFYLRLSPRDRYPFYLTGMGISLFLSRRFEEAAAKLQESLEHLPSHALTYRVLAACYAHLGRAAEAREMVERLQTLSPVVLDRVLRYRNPEHRELYVSGLHKAMCKAG